MLQLISLRDVHSIIKVNGLTSVLSFIRFYSNLLHGDVLEAGLDLISLLCLHADIENSDLNQWIDSLCKLLNSSKSGLFAHILRAYSNLVDRFTHLKADLNPLINSHITNRLLDCLCVSAGVKVDQG